MGKVIAFDILQRPDLQVEIESREYKREYIEKVRDYLVDKLGEPIRHCSRPGELTAADMRRLDRLAIIYGENEWRGDRWLHGGCWLYFNYKDREYMARETSLALRRNMDNIKVLRTLVAQGIIYLKFTQDDMIGSDWIILKGRNMSDLSNKQIDQIYDKISDITVWIK